MMDRTEIEKNLLELPNIILTQELSLIEQTQKQAEDTRKADEIKTVAKVEADMNLNFKNEGQRKASVELQLKDNAAYQEILPRMQEREKQIRIAQVNLSFQRDLLKSYLAIAGMGK